MICEVRGSEFSVQRFRVGDKDKISTRYPDEKLKFYKMCTYEFTKENFKRMKEIYKCLLKKISPLIKQKH
jgi:hypothetical protein